MTLFERLKAAAAADWGDYVGHPFVRQLGDGSLPEAAFRAYLVQDYLFLIHFARAWALDRRFEPGMAEATRQAKYARWKRAVAATLAV